MPWAGVAVALAFVACAPASAVAAPPSEADGIAFFEKHIRPVLVAQCYACHSAESKKHEGGLVVDSRAGLLEGGDSGPSVVPGHPEQSLLIGSLKHEDGVEMPKDKPQMSAEVIAKFEAWVKMGAPDPRDGKPSVARGIDYPTARQHWAYQPVKVTSPGAVQNTGKNNAWPRGEIDKYILAGLEAAKLQPAEPANPVTLLRRLSFDLTGLPPTLEEQFEFEREYAANAEKAVAAAVDRLLNSPRFGEHWARHWLDGVRFNGQLNNVFFYRDWVIRALNANMPYDQFVRMQLAGDLLPTTGDPVADDDRIIATQMVCLNVREMDRIEGTIEAVAQQLLGVSINCAKCHDHKYDAYSQEDYYALAGIFTSTEVAGAKGPTDAVALSGAKGAKIMAQKESKKIADTNLLIRGERGQAGPVVPRRFPIVLAGENQKPLGEITKQSGRLELANWIASAENPLTARVAVNRLWQRMFGEGLVRTPNDFGAQGEPPTHPELLDYLAHRFVQSGWSMKDVLREIALSKTYQQSSSASREAIEQDSDNKLHARHGVRRLTAEQLADNLASVGGTLTFDPLPRDMKQGNYNPRPEGDDKGKPPRAVYGIDQTLHKQFDGADPEILVDVRGSSVTAPQMLYFVNSNTVNKIATLVATRTQASNESAETARVEKAYRLLYGRVPGETERKSAGEFLKSNSFERFCHLLLCGSEFIYIE